MGDWAPEPLASGCRGASGDCPAAWAVRCSAATRSCWSNSAVLPVAWPGSAAEGAAAAAFSVRALRNQSTAGRTPQGTPEARPKTKNSARPPL